MLHYSNKTPITRFTYDWLIRFAELYPFDAVECYKDETIPMGPYDYYKSKYAEIPPMFTALIIRYAPHVFNVTNLYIKKDKIQHYFLPSSFMIEHNPSAYKKQTVFICDNCKFSELTPGMITRLKNHRITVYGKDRSIVHWFDGLTSLTPKLERTELIYLLQRCEYDTKVNAEANLTENLMFSEIWPLIAHCKDITLRIENLVYDENTADVLRANRFGPDSLSLWWINLPDTELLRIFDFILSLPVRPRHCSFSFSQERQKSLGGAIIKKYVDAGVTNMRIDRPADTFNRIECDENDNVCFLTFRVLFED